MQISERIYKYLEEKRMSQIEFARKTGISQSTISDWRRKGTNPSADKIMIICEVLQVSPTELLTGVPSKLENVSGEAEYAIFHKESKEYQLIESYRDLDYDGRNRLEGYVSALKDMQ